MSHVEHVERAVARGRPLRLLEDTLRKLTVDGFFANGCVSIIDLTGGVLLVEECTFEHDNDALVHVDRGLLDRLKEPDLSSLKLEQLYGCRLVLLYMVS